jgi:hypothetical protein
MEAELKKKHIAPDARRKDRISADTGHRKDVKKAGAGSKFVLGKAVSRIPRARRAVDCETSPTLGPPAPV